MPKPPILYQFISPNDLGYDFSFVSGGGHNMELHFSFATAIPLPRLRSGAKPNPLLPPLRLSFTLEQIDDLVTWSPLVGGWWLQNADGSTLTRVLRA